MTGEVTKNSIIVNMEDNNDSISRFASKWFGYLAAPSRVLTPDYEMDIELKRITSKIKKMSKRRQKIALAKRKSIVLKNAYPIALDNAEFGKNEVTVDCTFSHIQIKFADPELLKAIHAQESTDSVKRDISKSTFVFS